MFLLRGLVPSPPLRQHEMLCERVKDSEICVLSVDEQTERGQGRSQLGGLAAGGGEEGVVLELLEGLQRAEWNKHLTHPPGHRLNWMHSLGEITG